MANRARGEASVTIDGTTYTLRPTINSICDLEDLLGQTFVEIGKRATAGELRSMRALIWSYLQDRHGDEIKTVQDAGHWIERAGGLAKLETTLADVLALNKPPADLPASPRAAQAELAGVGSTSKGDGTA